MGTDIVFYLCVIVKIMYQSNIFATLLLFKLNLSGTLIKRGRSEARKFGSAEERRWGSGVYKVLLLFFSKNLF